MTTLFSLSGKTAIITGGSTHLGKAISEGICEFGGKAVICSRNKGRNEQLALELSNKYRTPCIGAYLDFTNEKSVAALIDQVIAQFSSIDILINNAAYSVPGQVHTQQPDDFMRGLNGTIGGTYLITKKALSIMMQQKKGSIINIASMYGLVSPNPRIYEETNNPPNPVSYGCGKAAVIQLTKYIACNYASYGIRANAIAPGPFPNSLLQQDQAFIHELKHRTPMQRIGVPNDLKGLSVFLASDASSYITGQTISVDGGWTTW